ncbi:MAG: ABC transporter permease [Chitinophagaceae bacterium]
MIKNYLLIALKHMRKQKTFSLINILGLTVGISSCLLIFLFIQNELSVDDFHKKGKNIYRVYRTGDRNGKQEEVPYLSPPFGPALANDYSSAVQSTVRVMRDNDLISYKNTSFNEKNIFLTDSNFFNFFDFQLVKGDRASVLKDPNSIVLTETAVKKYFGKEDPIGKVLEFNKQQQLKVTGVAKDVPSNSHLQFDMVVPLELLRPQQPGWFTQWPSNGLFVYVQLNPAVNPDQLKGQFPSFMNKYLGEYYARSGFKMGLTIKPLKDIYFAPDEFDNVKHGSKKMVYIFMSIAGLILIIACINFINLATARATDRAKEVGLRKTLGALKGQIAGQFILESLIFAAIACLLAIGLVQLLMPAYSDLLGYRLPSFLQKSWTYIFLIAVIIVVGLLAGSYPAFLLSSFSPIASLKGKLRAGRGSVFFRKSLVVFQFAVSVLLIIGVTTIVSQMNYLKNTEMGFNKEQSMIVRFDNIDIMKKRLEFKNELKEVPSVETVSLMSGEPGGFYDGYSFAIEDKPGENFRFNTEFTDLDFVKTLGLKIVAGRDFSAAFATDSAQAIILNRHASAELGYTPEQIIGKRIKNISRDSLYRTVVGVVENYHYSSLKEEIGSLAISPGTDRRLALIKIKNTNQLASTINAIKKAYTSFAPSYPFEYDFLDERFNQLYKTEEKQEAVLTIFSIIAIFIACLGLFGLASYTAIKRTKEIGVRKVLGSSVQNVVLLLSKDLLQPVLIGTVIVIPVAYYFMDKWLQGFAYRIDMSWWIFALGAIIAFSIAFLTISFQAIKAAVANPIKSLRTE